MRAPARHLAVPPREEAQVDPRPWSPRPQPLRGRHGEVHRLRAVRRGVPGRLHLRPRRRQSSRRPGVARRALRIRVRDQLPALHPLRPVRRGVPDRGHHRVQALRVLLHEPGRRHLHQARALVDDDGRPQRLPWEDWREGDDLHTSGWMRATSPSGSAAYEGRVQWSGELGYGVRAPEGGQSGNARRRQDREPPAPRDVHGAPRRPRAPARAARHAGGDAAHAQAHGARPHHLRARRRRRRSS